MLTPGEIFGVVVGAWLRLFVLVFVLYVLRYILGTIYSFIMDIKYGDESTLVKRYLSRKINKTPLLSYKTVRLCFDKNRNSLNLKKMYINGEKGKVFKFRVSLLSELRILKLRRIEQLEDDKYFKNKKIDKSAIKEFELEQEINKIIYSE